MDSILNEISLLAQDLKASGETDLDTCKISVLFPFIESLGYDTTTVGDVQTAPLYTPDASYKVDYGLRDINPNDFKTVIKVIGIGGNPKDEHAKIRTCILQKDTVGFVIITDCFKYYVYAYDSINNSLVDLSEFDICDISTINEEVIEVLENPIMNRDKQEYAEYDGNEPQEEEEYEGPKSAIQAYTPQADDTPKENAKVKTKWVFLTVGLAIIVLLLILIIVSVRNPNSSFMKFFMGDSQNQLDYYDIQSDLSVTLNKTTQSLDISFYSKDIPEGGVVKFEILNGDSSSAVYGEVSSSGRISGQFKVPETWSNPQITVASYLRFDEKDKPQPQSVRNKFGEVGDKILGKDGAPNKFALGFVSIEYDSAAVQEYLKWLKEQEEANLRAERLADFDKFELRYDSVGNIKIIPKGYDMNNINITGNVHVYPQIFYDANSGFSHFYLVAGQISSVTWSMFRSVSFYADGTAWTYDIGSNEKKQQVTGQYITEWIYFDNFNIATLPTDTAILGTSDVSEVTFNGSKAGRYTLSADEKANISSMLALYNKYFTDSSNLPSISWFEEENSSNGSNPNIDENNYTFSYIYTPSSLIERDSSDQKSLNKLKDIIAGGTASATQEVKFDIDSKKYRPLSENFKTQLINEFKDAVGMLVYEQDYDSSDMDYYKIYFNYENAKSIESGYIPYIYVMENKTVYIPVKTSTGGTISEKAYASFSMSQKTFDMLKEEVLATPYEQIDK